MYAIEFVQILHRNKCVQSDIDVAHGLISDWFEGLSTFSTRTDTFSCQKIMKCYLQ